MTIGEWVATPIKSLVTNERFPGAIFVKVLQGRIVWHSGVTYHESYAHREFRPILTITHLHRLAHPAHVTLPDGI